MLIWLLGVAVFVFLWSGLWRAQPKAAFGVLLGLLLAWIFSRLITPYVTGMTPIPLWLPPLPIAIIALTLFVFGTITWFRADNLPPPRQRDDDDGHDQDHAHGADHGHDHGHGSKHH
ncbi:MAG TPA: hypothetical protein VL131_11180 [Gammaproteobacteria bacterium]|nr:hypothetical protein [Gammaproteobacteria bacterium]